MNTKIKILCVIAAVLILCSCLAGCGNYNIGFGNYTFKHVHVSDGTKGYCAEVTSWHDNEMGIELHTTEFGDMYCSEGTYVLFGSQDKCPYCN